MEDLKEFDYLTHKQKATKKRSKWINMARESIENHELMKIQNKQYEENLYAEFVRCNKGKDFIKLEDVECLGIDYDILFLVSVKNVGKTTNIIFNRFHHYRALNKKVIYGRCSQNELLLSSPELNNCEQNPFIIKKVKSVWTLIDKENGAERGRCVDFKFCNAIAGGSFSDYGAIIFDEILTWDPKQIINRAHLNNWSSFLSSIVRNKKKSGEDKLTVYLLGNITATNDAILKYYKINRDDNLRVIHIGEGDKKCVLLFINANNIYRGIMDQEGAAQHLDEEARIALFNNEHFNDKANITPPKLFDIMEEHYNFVMPVKEEVVLFEIRRERKNNLGIRGKMQSLRCGIYKSFLNIKSKIYTGEIILKNSYPELYFTHDLDNIKEELFFAMKANQIEFYDSLALKLANEIFRDIEKEKKFIG